MRLRWMTFALTVVCAAVAFTAPTAQPTSSRTIDGRTYVSATSGSTWAPWSGGTTTAATSTLAPTASSTSDVRLWVSANGGTTWAPWAGISPSLIYDVRAYGAAGDGVTDDKPAIQRAFNAVMAAKTGTVWFPCGTYAYSATMALYGASDADADRLNGVVIAGEHCAILKHPNAYFNPWNVNLATPDGAVFLVSHADNVTVKGLTFQGYQDNNKGVADSVIHLTGRGRNNTVEDVIVYDHWRGTPIDYSGSERGIIQNNFIFNSSLGIQQSSAAGSAIIAGNNISGQHTFAGNTGAQIYVSGVHSVVSGNYVEVPTSTEYGIQVADAADFVEVTGNTVRGIAVCTAGITYFPSGSTYGSMTGNSVRNCTTGLAIAGIGHSIVGNTVYGNGAGTDGIRLYLGSSPATYVSVSANNLQNVATGITGNSLVVDHAIIGVNSFGSGVTPLVTTGWTNSVFTASPQAPTISSGFGSSPTIAANNSSLAFTINVGTGGVATGGVIGLTPAAPNGWSVHCDDVTTQSTTVFITKQTATSTTSATIGNFNTAGAAAAWVASNILVCQAAPY